MPDENKTYYTVGQAAAKLGYRRQTIGNLIRQGKLSAHRFSKDAHYRIPAAEVDQLLEEMKKKGSQYHGQTGKKEEPIEQTQKGAENSVGNQNPSLEGGKEVQNMGKKPKEAAEVAVAPATSQSTTTTVVTSARKKPAAKPAPAPVKASAAPAAASTEVPKQNVNQEKKPDVNKNDNSSGPGGAKHWYDGAYGF